MVTLRVLFLDSLNCVPISQYDQSCKINNYLASSKEGGKIKTTYLLWVSCICLVIYWLLVVSVFRYVLFENILY